MNRLSVIIPSRNANNFKVCADAVRRHEPRARIILIDDGIDPKWLDAYEHPLAIYRTGKPFIFSRNVNAGIMASCRDDVVLLNDDAILESEGGLTLMQAGAEEHPEYGCIGAVTNWSGQRLQSPSSIGLREVPYIAFICVLIPRRTIDRIGLLDERYCIDYGMEDRDYCEAITRAGMKVGVHDSCYVDHGRLTSTFRGSPNTPKSFAENLKLFNAKWGLA